MTVTDLRPSMSPGANRTGQGTLVEQTRAAAEVAAAVQVAQAMPRDIGRAVRDMKRSCGQRSLAEKAFYRFPRGGQQVSGETVHLARELARCWGNIQYGLVELRRDDAYGQSEVMAFAWDVETNARASTTFIVPHVRDRSDRNGGSVPLVDARDIYENNANNGARRLREQIFAVLPGWYVEDAVTACYETLAGNDEERPQRIDRAVAAFATQGVNVAQLEQKLGAPRDRWAPYDLAQLAVIHKSLLRGETTKEAEFGTAASLTAAEIIGQPPAAPNGNGAHKPATAASNGEEQGKKRRTGRKEPAAADEAGHDDADAEASPDPAPPAGNGRPPARATSGQLSMIEALFRGIGLGGEEHADARIGYAARLAGASIDALGDLDQEQAQTVREALKGCADEAALQALAYGEPSDG